MKYLEDILKKRGRLDWDEYFMSITVLTSLRSPSIKKKVGAVIVKRNRIISTGYNGFPSNSVHKSLMIDGKEVNTIHAEQNAIAQCAKMGISCDGCEIYVSHFPCINCAKMIIGSGISVVKYLKDNHNEKSIDFLMDSGVEIIKIS